MYMYVGVLVGFELYLCLGRGYCLGWRVVVVYSLPN